MKILVVGGGAAGMMAAVAAAENGNEVTLLEKNEKLGKKIYITGKGRCNFTNACDAGELMEHVVTNPKFLYGAFRRFDNTAVMDFFQLHGMEYKIERGNRAFPVSDHSSDVIRTLQHYLEELGVSIRLNTKMTGLITEQKRVLGVATTKGDFSADAVILALGGRSYPSCGANGDTWKLFVGTDVVLQPAEPSLVPLVVAESEIGELQGLSLKNVRFTLRLHEKNVYSETGEMLFTHFGLSGPLVLSASCYLKEADYKEQPVAEIDLKPALQEKQLDERILRDFAEFSHRQFKNALGKLLPAKLIPFIIQRSGIDPEKKVNRITKEERQRLLYQCKHFTFRVTGNRGFREAIITRGGISTGEINPKTMELKKIKALYVAGEMIDVDALTGGFNLQIAWSTGHLCGASVSEPKQISD